MRVRWRWRRDDRHGFDLVHHGPADLPGGRTHITPDNLFDHVRSVAAGADTVMIAGNGLRAIGDRHPCAHRNQVLLWRVLYAIDDYGRLFAITVPLE